MALRATLVAACICLGVFHVVIASDDPAFAEVGLAQTLDAQDEEIRLLREEIESLKLHMRADSVADEKEVDGEHPQVRADLASFSPAMNQRDVDIETLAEPI